MTNLSLGRIDRRRLIGSGLALAALPQAAWAVTPAEAAASIAPGGTLRAAINYGNTVLAQRAADGALTGISVQLATELARRLGLPLKLVPYPAAGQVTGVARQDDWDVAFLAIDPKRAEDVTFTPPYIIIDATYLVAKDSPYKAVADIDQPGATVVVSRGAAYDLVITRTLKHATIMRVDTPPQAIDYFLKNHVAGVASVRKLLDDTAATHPDVRVLPDAITRVDQAMAIKPGRAPGLEYVKAFVEEMKASGFVKKALDSTGQAATVAPPA